MDSNFKPYRTGMLTVKEKYVCGREDKINKSALVKKKWTQAERLLATPLICSAQWPEALASSTSPCIGRG